MSVDRADALKRLADHHDRDTESLSSRLTELEEQMKDQGVSNPTERALRKLNLSLKGSGGGERTDFVGLVMGASDPINTSESAKRRAAQAIENQGVDAVVNQGMIKPFNGDTDMLADLASLEIATGDGGSQHFVVLDSNANSPTSGEVLPAEDCIRYVHGAATPAEDPSGPQWFSGVLSCEDRSETPPVPPVFEPVEFTAAQTGSEGSVAQLRFDGPEPFEAVEEGPDPHTVLEGNSDVSTTPLSETTADNFGRNDLVATRGVVSYMELSPEGDQSRRFSVREPFAFDSDLERTVWLPDWVDVDFAVESEVYIVGRVSPSSNADYPDSLQALGVMPHPELGVAAPDPDSVSAEPDGPADPQPEPADVTPDQGGADIDLEGTIEEETGSSDSPDEQEAAADGGDGGSDEWEW